MSQSEELPEEVPLENSEFEDDFIPTGCATEVLDEPGPFEVDGPAAVMSYKQGAAGRSSSSSWATLA